MLSIDHLITAVVNNIRTQFPELVSCEALAGFIETTTREEIHAKTPGVYVACVGTGDLLAVESGERDLVVRMVAYLILVNAADSQKREVEAQRLTTNLLDYIGWQRWGLENVHPAQGVQSTDVHGLTKNFEPHIKDWRLDVSVLARAADLYGADDPVSNLSLWAITWEQMLRIGTDVYDDSNEKTPNQVYSRFETAHSTKITMVTK